MSSAAASLAARANAQKRHHGATSPEYINARRDHAAAAIETAVAKYLADAPPLTDEQVERIAGLLGGLGSTQVDSSTHGTDKRKTVR